jgi:tight adherence protein C
VDEPAVSGGGVIASSLPLAWALLVVGIASRYRPPPARLRALAGSAARPSSQAVSPAGAGRAAAELVERLGRGLLQRAGWPAAPPAARRLGTALVAAVAVVPLMPLLALPTALTAWALPSTLARRRDQRRQAAVAAGLPEVVDLLALAVGSGLTVHLALAQVARRAEGPLAAELARVVDEVALGRRLADALDDLPARAGEALRPLVAALVASERYGAPLGAGLDRLADEVRRERRRRAEEAARKVPVKLLFPLVTCTLPAFGLLTVAPLIASAVRSLRI